MDRTPFYITTPIYYVNSVPHLGTAYTTIAADALARYRRMTPQEWVDSIAPKFVEAWKMLDITNDDFIRTTEPRHTRASQKLMQTLRDNGYIYQGHYEGWYCVPDETFYTADQLVEGKCPGCGRDVQFIQEDNWFFKLSAFQERLLEHYRDNPKFVQPDTRRNEVLSFVEGGLRDLSVSRTAFTWGCLLYTSPSPRD